MKKLSKIKLHNIVEMTDNEMKKVVGGFGTEEPTGDSGGDSCSGSAVEQDLTCDGNCPDKYRWDPVAKRFIVESVSCKKNITHASDDPKKYVTICYC